MFETIILWGVVIVVIIAFLKCQMKITEEKEAAKAAKAAVIRTLTNSFTNQDTDKIIKILSVSTRRVSIMRYVDIHWIANVNFIYRPLFIRMTFIENNIPCSTHRISIYGDKEKKYYKGDMDFVIFEFEVDDKELLDCDMKLDIVTD